MQCKILEYAGMKEKKKKTHQDNWGNRTLDSRLDNSIAAKSLQSCLTLCDPTTPSTRLVLVKLYIPVYNRNGKICNSVQSFKRLLKNGFLYFYATFIVLVSHFFISKFSVQVLSQDNLIYTLPEGTPSRIHRVLRWGAPTHVTNMKQVLLETW